MRFWHRRGRVVNLAALRSFIAVTEAGSFRAAAEHLHVVQSVLSRQIIALEREIGAVLLTRKPRGVELTRAGEIVLKHARASLGHIDLARAEIAAVEGLRTGRVSIAAIGPVADAILPQAIVAFARIHPGIGFDVRVGNTPHVLGLLSEGVVELGVAYNAPLTDGLHVRCSIEQPLVAVVRAGHPLADEGGQTLPALAEWPAILPPRGSPTRLLIDEAARRADVRLRDVLLESDSVGLRVALAARTDAVAILAPLSAATAEQVRAIAISDPMLGVGRIDLLASDVQAISPATTAFEPVLRRFMRGHANRDASLTS